MSEHKTGLSNWTDKQRANYWDRREKGLRGQTGAATVHQTILTDKGPQSIPLGNKIGGSRLFNRLQAGNAWQSARLPQPAFVQRQHKASARGD